MTTGTIERAVAELDARAALAPLPPALAFDRAQLLEMLGRKDEAVRGYVAVLACEPAHADALNALGLLTLGIGNREAARTLLSGAVLHGPGNAAAHANLAYLYLGDGNLAVARALYERALALDAGLAIAHHGMAELLLRAGDASAAAQHRAQGMRSRPITLHRYRGEGRPIRVLALGSAALGNVATDAYFDDRVFLLASLVVEYYDPAVPLPPHDLIFNVIGEADLCAGALDAAATIARQSDAPMINAPSAVAATSRAANARRLRSLAGVVAPRMVTLARDVLAAPAAPARLAHLGFGFPLLVRSPGYHTGDHFVKVDTAGGLADAIAALPGDELLVIEYIDVRDAAGDSRKYRAMIVDGKLYPLHLAISRDWKVHYFSADMQDSAEHRAADAAFLHDMEAILGRAALDALERVRAALALDFGGIDFTVDAAGKVIVFEANASMIVPFPAGEAIWDYRRAPVERIHAAVRAMLTTRANCETGHSG
jgi:hypothetical protein